MDSQNHREDKTKTNKISGSIVVNPNHMLFSRWFWLPMDPGILVFLFFGFLDGFGYPSGLHTCIVLVFSMVLRMAFAIKVVSSCIPYTCSFPSCLHTWMPLVFIGFTNGFCFHIGFKLRSCMPPMGSSMYWRAFLVNYVLASTRACFKISVLVQTRTQFPIAVIFVSCRWCSRLGESIISMFLGESIISMFECGHIVLRMMLSPARGHMLFNTCVIVRDFVL